MLTQEMALSILIGIFLLFLTYYAIFPMFMDWRYLQQERKSLAESRKGSLFAGTVNQLSIEQIGKDKQLRKEALRTAITVYPPYQTEKEAETGASRLLFTVFPRENQPKKYLFIDPRSKFTEHLQASLPTYLNIPIENLRGYFYQDTLETDAAVWLHYEEEGYWNLLKIPVKSFMEITDVQAFLAALSVATPDEQKLAFARKPPYVHREIASAYPVRQRITGDWEELGSQQLYLMPTYLVLLDEQDKVIRSFGTEYIWQIEALPRMDKAGEGVLRFQYGEELLSFSLADCEAWASDLALAVSKAQEIPVEAELLEIKKKVQN